MPFEESSSDSPRSSVDSDRERKDGKPSVQVHDPDRSEARRHSNWRRDLIENALTVVLAVGVSVGCRAVVAEPRWIPSGSMLPTLEIGDRLVVEKISYRFHPPRRGDIVVFYPPFQDDRERVAYIKRVVGIPGDTIKITEGQVFINGVAIKEPYIQEPPLYTCPGSCSGIRTGDSEFAVPPESYFVMGDNRNDSQDSHAWGFLPKENIIGHTVYRFWPLDRLHYFDKVEYPMLSQSPSKS